MLDVALHTGIEHPNLLWIVVASILSLGTGLFLGLRADREEQKATEAVETTE